jgi:ADP-ribose pyrophosphatase YjhB (NUDIX family)
MTTDRRFCSFSRREDAPPFRLHEIPEDGFCLSAFVLVRSERRPTAVLLGRINPKAPWDHLGALDEGRIEAHRHGWMIPSSHLLLHEAPDAAAARILTEQLGLRGLPLEGPLVVSEVYTPLRFHDLTRHWDLEFLYFGETGEEGLSPQPAWQTLEFVETRTLRPDAMARSHEDVLASAGFPLATRPA